MIVVCRLSWLNVLRTLKKTIFTTSKSVSYKTIIIIMRLSVIMIDCPYIKAWQ